MKKSIEILDKFFLGNLQAFLVQNEDLIHLLLNCSCKMLVPFSAWVT